MRCRIGYWKTGLALQVDEEAYEWVRLAGKSVRVTLLHDRRFMFTGTHGGARFGRIIPGSQTARKKAAGIYAEASNVPIDRSLAPDLQFPLFEIHDLDIGYDFARDALVTDPLEADHELPWPREKHRAERLSSDELQRQCYLRIRSHLLLGGHGYFDEVGVPCEVVRTMAGGYAKMLEKARTEIEIGRQALAA